MTEYFEFKGVRYGVGTIAKVPNTLDLRWRSKDEIMAEAEFIGKSTFVFLNNKNWCIRLYEDSGHLSGKYEEYIEIVTPVYYQMPTQPDPQNIFIRTKSGSWDAHNEVCSGLIWYIAVMLLAIIFKERVGIWILTTIIYFLWKANK